MRTPDVELTLAATKYNREKRVSKNIPGRASLLVAYTIFQWKLVSTRSSAMVTFENTSLRNFHLVLILSQPGSCYARLIHTD